MRLRLLALALLASAPAARAEPPPLRWGSDPTGGAPFLYQDAAGNYRGFEWELAAYLGEKLGRKPELRSGDWSKLPQWLEQPADAAGGIDIVLNGYEQRDDLSRQYLATNPYYRYRLVLVGRDGDTALNDWGDLRAGGGKSVGVLNGSAAHEYLIAAFADSIRLQINDDVANVFGLVQDGRMDATVQDSPAAAYYLRDMPGLKPVGVARQPGLYVMYLRQGDVATRDAINAALKDGWKSGRLRDIYAKYGLWNGDQEWLTYTETGEWPGASADAPAAAGGGAGGSPWPRFLRELAGAAGMTVLLAVASFPLAMLIGMAAALGRVYGPRWLAAMLGVYVEVVRGTPLLLQLYSVFYLIPRFIPGFALSPLEAGILGLAVNYSAYEAENYRAGLLAVPHGQMEAALALGMTRRTALRRVVVPQAARIVIPPVTNDFIALFKDTSVCSVILITELTRKYNELYNFNRDYVAELAFVTAGLYLLMSYPLAVVARWLERRNEAGK